MSAATRLAAASSRFVDAHGRAPQLGLNSAQVPGGVGAVVLPHEVPIGGVVFTPEDGRAHGATIGAALALEVLRASV